MMHELSGKTVLVTGASKGIGAAIAAASVAAGARVVAHYGTDKDGAAAATAAAPEGTVKLLAADLSEPHAALDLVEEAIRWAGRLDCVVNNAAVMRIDGGVDSDLDRWDAVWEEAFAVNVKAPADLMRAATNHFLAVGGGTIVSISSWAAYRGMASAGGLAYAASKAATATTTKALARAYADKGLLAYVIVPGVVETRLSIEAAEAGAGIEAVVGALAMKEMVPPHEIGELVVFLASGRCRHLNGAMLDVNGASYIR
ncbi:SDR family oxidoreductase [Acuticoccus sp. M5D2P5]|uniref:SDR family NAD(P)-dependent oxidoreductase n=1 Tax=Acuticoccus kalidii TaxID=2910977 RepID=UPI001F158259|nr:SDR family oxidoreductase [Acuticoccus kalidii]MCF3932512.1 SDR family oxidoreductase [Acuticoccus kalidii]